MNKQQTLDVLMLLSALESWAFAQGKPMPDYLHDRIFTAIELLSKQVLKTGEKA